MIRDRESNNCIKWQEDLFCRFVALSLTLMPILPIDSGRYGSKEIREIFEDERRLQYQLDFESTVAQVQARLGIIPAEASG